jgi:hypothetical protein
VIFTTIGLVVVCIFMRLRLRRVEVKVETLASNQRGIEHDLRTVWRRVEESTTWWCDDCHQFYLNPPSDAAAFTHRDQNGHVCPGVLKTRRTSHDV